VSVASRSTGSKRKRPFSRRRGPSPRACNARVREDLLFEALTSLRLAFAEFGTTRAEFERALRRSRREKRVTLEDFRRETLRALNHNERPHGLQRQIRRDGAGSGRGR